MSGNCEVDAPPESTGTLEPDSGTTNLTSTSSTNTITSNLVPIIGGGIGGLVVICAGVLGIFFIHRKTRLDREKPPGSTHGWTSSETNDANHPPRIIETSISSPSTITSQSYYTENGLDPPSRGVSRSHYSATTDYHSRSQEQHRSQISHQSQGTEGHLRSSGRSHGSSHRHPANYHPDPGGRSRVSGHASQRSNQRHYYKPDFKDQAREVAAGPSGSVPVAQVVAIVEEECLNDDSSLEA